MADLAKWQKDYGSPSPAPYSTRSEQDERVRLLYYEFAAIILEFMAEKDREDRGTPVHLDQCIEEILFSEVTTTQFPDMPEEAVKRVIATLNEATLLTFQYLDNTQIEQETAIIKKVSARGVERYYLTDTGRTLCGLSFQAEHLQNIDLDMLYLERFLRHGEFEQFFKTCEDRISTLHTISSRLIRITSTRSWLTQWEGLTDQKERVLEALSKTLDIVNKCSEILDSEEVQSRIDIRAKSNPNDQDLDIRINILLDRLVGALFGVRKNFEELVDASEAKHIALVEVIDFFESTQAIFENDDFDDDFFEAQFSTFGVVSPQLYSALERPNTREPWAAASVLDLFKKVPFREKVQLADIEEVPPPPPSKNTQHYQNNFDGMMGNHAEHILALLMDKGTLSLMDYFKQIPKSTVDADIPALFALFAEPKALKLLGVHACSEVIQPSQKASWPQSDGTVLCFSDIQIVLQENSV